MLDPRTLSIADFDYPLPDERIAKFPVEPRDAGKLLIYRSGQISQDIFRNLTTHLPRGPLMVFNNTRVIHARLRFRKGGEHGALIEIFLLEPHTPRDYQQNFAQTSTTEWACLVGNLKRWKTGTLSSVIPVKGLHVILTAERLTPLVQPMDGNAGRQGGDHIIRFTWATSTPGEPIPFATLLEAAGELPIPPYLNRPTQPSDLTTYQTVYARTDGSVAAPTAGLHFTPQVLHDIDRAGIERQEVTLHVGAGTFLPVKSAQIGDHPMHAEHIFVTSHLLQRLLAHQGRAIAVGTTSVRTLETLYYIGLRLQSNPNATPDELAIQQWEPYETSAPNIPTVQALQNILDWLHRNQLDALHTTTRIIIAPPYTYHVAEAILTNFHQPQSTLLLLVAAFLKGDWRPVYEYALSHQFRFLSYGDASLLIPGPNPAQA